MNMDEEALLARAIEEREKLFLRYDKGREPGAEIDEWEDPGFEVYHQTDRYGFIHDKRLPQKMDPNETKMRAIEMERVKKWLKMQSRWNSKETDEKLKRRIYKGIPDKLRSQVWMKLLNIEKTMKDKKDVYQNMLKLARQWSTEARQIDSDVNRQFREHLFYRERYSIKQKSLFNVLTAYSMYNMEVGYCQGMSGVAGVLLMYMDEEEAFWALSTLLADRRFAMHGLYIEGFPKLNRLIQHHDRILERCLPKLKRHFDVYNLDSMIYSLKWFFVIFIERIPFSLCLRVWDIYLLDGERVVTAMAYTILKLHQKKLLKLKDMDLLVQYLQTKLHKEFGYDDDNVIKSLEQSMEELKKLKIDLAPNPQDIEYPKRTFGEFVEPTVETKIGIRKSSFTETEKKVTENVLSRIDETQQQLENTNISESDLGASNSQINTTAFQEENWEFLRKSTAIPSRFHTLPINKDLHKIIDIDEKYSSLPNRLLHGNIPESEDGGSLLGSSRKSLADTSITSTADLSVFSVGQKSQQYDICIDESHSIHSDAEGEDDSPGSAFGSLSIVGRTPSAMMITPTPRAISPQDIVRIYVPPPPLDENTINVKSINSSRGTSPNKKSPNKLGKNLKELNSSDIKSSSKFNSDNNVVRNSTITAIENSSTTGATIESRRQSFNYKSDEDLTINGEKSTSSSRRASLSRKSPSIFNQQNKVVMECEHLRKKRKSIDSTSEGCVDYHEIYDNSDNNIEFNPQLIRTKVMTSFEELARKQKNIKTSQNINNTRIIQSACITGQTSDDEDDFSPTKTKYDDCNTQYSYKALTTSPSDYEFYKSDSIIISTTRKKSNNSDENSSSSPNNKSVLTTPVNEQITLELLTTSQSSQNLLNSGDTTPTMTYTTSQIILPNTINRTTSIKSSCSSSSNNKIGANRFSSPSPTFDEKNLSSNNIYSSSVGSTHPQNIGRSYSSNFRPRVYSNDSSSGGTILNTHSTLMTNPKGNNMLIGTSRSSPSSFLSEKYITSDYEKHIETPIGGGYEFNNSNRDANKIRIKVEQKH